jgi:hypothetical protein
MLDSRAVIVAAAVAAGVMASPLPGLGELVGGVGCANNNQVENQDCGAANPACIGTVRILVNQLAIWEIRYRAPRYCVFNSGVACPLDEFVSSTPCTD